MTTIRISMAEALLRFIDQQYIELDGVEHKFVCIVMGIFGHGNVMGIGEALAQQTSNLRFIQGHNEQGMVHAATAFAKQRNRLEIIACTTSIGPGALNMVTGAATATINRIPVLLLPGDNFACRQPDPVLQQLELGSDHTVSVNDCFKPVSKYWDRIERPEQLMQAMHNAFRILTDPVETGAVTICLPQDVQTQTFEYPKSFFAKKVHIVDRRIPSPSAIQILASALAAAKSPLIVAGGGVHYSLAVDALGQFASEFGIPVAETQGAKGLLAWNHAQNLGVLGVLGARPANIIAKEADVILALGTRWSDFTTASKTVFQNSDAKIFHMNVSGFDANKLDAVPIICDVKCGLQALSTAMRSTFSCAAAALSFDADKVDLIKSWHAEVDRVCELETGSALMSQTSVIGKLNRILDDSDIVVAASGSLPGDLARLWRCRSQKAFHLEYGFSCMGYEVAGGLGVKLAEQKSEVYVIVGDGAFLLMHSELFTSIQERQKINIILFNNHGYQCIRKLQIAKGGTSFGNEFRDHDNNIVPVDFAQYASSLGVASYHPKTLVEFERAIRSAKSDDRSTLIQVDVCRDSMSSGYETYWRVDA